MNVLWFVSSLEQKGGGERFALEGTQALRQQGHVVNIACDRLGQTASFDGRYDLSQVVCTAQQLDRDTGYLGKAFNKLRGSFALYGVIRRLAPDLVICQSEFDAIKLFLLSRVLRFKYRVFVFGQMYQFKTDISRYASVFRPHLETIVASRPGYRDTVTLPPPRLAPVTHLVNEVVSRLKFRALHAADQVFTLSNQVRWEVSLVYARDAVVARAAFDASYIDQAAVSNPRPVGSPLHLLSVSRLVDKKRVDLTIAAFGQCTQPARLTIIGTGPEEAKLKDLARSSPRSADIVFLGAVDDATLQREMAAADCFISMDIGDFDISVVEAMGKGVRVLVAQDFDLSAFGARFGGVISVPPEPDALCQAIDQIPGMPAPSAANLPALHQLTWQALAKACVADAA